MTDFAWALERMKEGERVARAGWNGKGQWVCYMPPTEIPADLVYERTRRFVPAGEPLRVQGYFVIVSVDGRWCPGWLASQADMQADDWGLYLDGR